MGQEKTDKKQEKLEKVALGAAEQSRRQMIPELQLLSNLLIYLINFLILTKFLSLMKNQQKWVRKQCSNKH